MAKIISDIKNLKNRIKLIVNILFYFLKKTDYYMEKEIYSPLLNLSPILKY